MVHNGIDLDTALSLPDDVRVAFAINFSEFSGSKFDWNRFEFVERKE